MGQGHTQCAVDVHVGSSALAGPARTSSSAYSTALQPADLHAASWGPSYTVWSQAQRACGFALQLLFCPGSCAVIWEVQKTETLEHAQC
jgi:hypothetical protein